MKTIEQLKVVNETEAPDYPTALKVQMGKFYSYNDYKTALSKGAKKTVIDLP